MNLTRLRHFGKCSNNSIELLVCFAQQTSISDQFSCYKQDRTCKTHVGS